MRAIEKRTLPAGAKFAVRKPPPRMSRRRRLVSVMVLLGVLGLLAGAAYWGLHTETFSVTRIETGSYRFTSPAVLDSVLGQFLGHNLLALKRDEVIQSMASLKWVRDIQIQRRLPGTLAIDFREWRPLAIVASGSDLPATGDLTLVLNEKGEILPFPADLKVPAIPTLVGYQPGGKGVAPEPKVENQDFSPSPESAPLLDLFQSIADVGLETVAAVDFIVVRPEGYAIVLEGGQGRLQVGREDFRQRLERYLTARPHLEQGLDVDLRFADRVTVHRPGSRAD